MLRTLPSHVLPFCVCDFLQTSPMPPLWEQGRPSQGSGLTLQPAHSLGLRWDLNWLGHGKPQGLENRTILPHTLDLMSGGLQIKHRPASLTGASLGGPRGSEQECWVTSTPSPASCWIPPTTASRSVTREMAHRGNTRVEPLIQSLMGWCTMIYIFITWQFQGLGGHKEWRREKGDLWWAQKHGL